MSVLKLRDSSGVQSAASREYPSLICFSHLRWNFVFQRPQHILTRAAKQFRVHFVEEPVIEPCEVPHLKVYAADGVTVVVPIVPAPVVRDDGVTSVRSLLSAYLAAAAPVPMVGWYYTPMALEASEHLAFPIRVYDCMDELSCFKGAPPELRALEQKLLAQADVVFTGGQSLYEAKSVLHDNVHALPSSIDSAHFAPARTGHLAEPKDLAHIPHPRIGYFGVLDERLDLDLVSGLACDRPDWHFVMVGPIAKIDAASLPYRANIHWLGSKQYAELPSYLAHLDAGWMPFALNDATRFISPTKTPEFLAAGLPLASTAITDVVRTYGAAGLVEIADGRAQMEQSLATLLARRGNKAWLARVDAHLATISWDDTWSRMRAEINRALGHRRPAHMHIEGGKWPTVGYV